MDALTLSTPQPHDAAHSGLRWIVRLPWLLCAGALLLTAFLALAGGPQNPFSVLYLLQVTVAAVALGRAWTYGVTVLSVGCYALLFFLPGQGHHGSGFSAHLQGMWLAFTACAFAIAYLVSGLAAALRRREAELLRAQALATRAERLASLTTLAAGAAHELGTPLGTIAVAAGELERAASALPHAGPLLEDVRLIRREVGRCRAILNQMSARAGEAEAPAPLALGTVVAALRRTLPEGEAERVRAEVDPGAALFAPRQLLLQVLGNLVRNALEASVPGAPVRLRARGQEGRLLVEVSDEGPGMAPEVLCRAGEPFFTTKAPGRGLGLGLFLARAFAEGLGGELRIESSPRGTTVTLVLPLRQALEADR